MILIKIPSTDWLTNTNSNPVIYGDSKNRTCLYPFEIYFLEYESVSIW